MSEPAAIILAAGLGTRMRSKRAKVLHELMGRPLIQLVIETVRAAGVGRVVVVVGHSADAVRATLADYDVRFVLQERQLGTGHAVMQAQSVLQDHSGPVLITAGDVPLLRSTTLVRLLEYHVNEQAAATVLSAVVNDATGYGRVLRGADEADVRGIVEHGDASAEQRSINEINSGTYCFSGELLFDALQQTRPDNVQGEYYLPDALDVLVRQGHTVRAMRMEDSREAMGINNRVQLAEAESVLRHRIIETWQLAGVTVSDPDTVYIDPAARLEPDATILPFTFIRGATYVGADARIGPHAEVDNSEIGTGAVIERSVVRDSRVGSDCTVGPFAYLRPGTVLEQSARAGTFVELKQAHIGKSSRVPHLSYVGDAHIGADVNIGAGVITCNYDGFDKHVTTVDDGAFVGSNTSLVAPIRIGAGAFTGAGSVITRDVEPDALAVERSEQIQRPGWAARRRGQRTNDPSAGEKTAEADNPEPGTWAVRRRIGSPDEGTTD